MMGQPMLLVGLQSTLAGPQSSFTTLGRRNVASRGLDQIDGLSRTVASCEGFNTFIVIVFMVALLFVFFLAELAS